MTEAVLVSVDGGVGVLTLNRPDKFNCISTELLDGLRDGMDRFEADPAVRAVLLNASGKQFCTGADLDEVLDRRQLGGDAHALHRQHPRGDAALRSLAAARGGGGAGPRAGRRHGDRRRLRHGVCRRARAHRLPACPLRPAARRRRHAAPGPPRRSAPGARPHVHRALARFAPEAERWGLFNHVVPDEELDTRARAYCADLAAKSRHGLAFMKGMARQGLEGPLEVGLALERGAVVAALQHSDVAEGLDAFQSRREPVFP